MKALRWILLPVALIYGVITFLRNKLYDWNIFKSFEIPGKSIVVGNLSVGGTGKSPHVDYLIEHFLSLGINISTLSRGYGRITKGIVLADKSSTPLDIGDEPTQYKSRYKSSIEVIVAEKRKLGIEFIQSNFPDNQLILLDDAFQHRAVKAGFNILITPYDDLFSKDFMLPTGNLREWSMGKNRADCIVVSKTPNNISEKDKKYVVDELNTRELPVFFSSIYYDELVSIKDETSIPFENALIVTGIANPSPLLEHWKSKVFIEHISFPDHHNFTSKDVATIHEKFGSFASRNKVIITTEKDYMRLRRFKALKDEKVAWYYQPITVKIDDQQKFNKLIDEYVTKI